MAGCAGIAETRRPASPGRAPLSQLIVLIDRDVIGAAFASYKGAVSVVRTKSGDDQAFIDHLVAGVQAEAQAAGVEASVEVVSVKARQAATLNTAFGRPVLMIRALSFAKGTDGEGGRVGWTGDTSWDFSLAERPTSGAYAKTWAAGIAHEDLNPTRCGDYERCGKSLANKVFVQMRRDGVVR